MDQSIRDFFLDSNIYATKLKDSKYDVEVLIDLILK